MKRIFSFLLAVVLLVSALPVAYAADTQDYSLGTAVVYTADEEANENWTVTVPAKLAPGTGGTVTLEGYWPSSKTITITAEENVVLTNSINANDKKTLDVEFDGISEAGDNNGKQTFTAPVSVADIEAALFGIWNGHFYYNVELEVQAIPSATFMNEDGTTTTLTWEELKLAENGQKYGYNVSTITEYGTGNAFLECKSLESIIIPDSMTAIDGGAFSQCSSLKNISLPDGLTSIGAGAFFMCESLETINIPNSVTTIDTFAFSNCRFANILLPTELKTLAESAFEGCINLQSVTIPTGVNTIGKYAFASNDSLTSVIIPDSITTIGDGAFSHDSSLINITFTGTVAQWKNIQKTIDGTVTWNCEVPATEVVCSDGTVALS